MTSFPQRVEQAAEAMRALFPETPLQESAYLSRKTGAHIFLKREDLSPVRSYKIRGAFNFFRKALAAGEGAESFVCASAGNHAQGFAFVCRHFGRKGVVFMPVTTPQQKIDKTRMFGGEWVEIRLTGDFFDDCYAAARAFAAGTGGLMVPPFDHRDIIEGQATVACELTRQMPADPDLVVLPVGGGGLAAGVTAYLAETGKTPRFLFAEPAGALAIDALKDLPRKDIRGRRIVLVVSGGNFDFERLPDVKERALRFEGLKKYFVFRFPQRPGALRDFLELLGPDDDIARFEYLKKSARNFGSVLIGIETRDRKNFDVLARRFHEAGWAYQDITDNETIAGLVI
jgi:threonine dehydratase